MMERRQHASFVNQDTSLLGLENVSDAYLVQFQQDLELLNVYHLFVSAELNQMMMVIIVRCVVLESFHQMEDIANHVHLEQ